MQNRWPLGLQNADNYSIIPSWETTTQPEETQCTQYFKSNAVENIKSHAARTTIWLLGLFVNCTPRIQKSHGFFRKSLTRGWQNAINLLQYTHEKHAKGKDHEARPTHTPECWNFHVRSPRQDKAIRPHSQGVFDLRHVFRADSIWHRWTYEDYRFSFSTDGNVNDNQSDIRRINPVREVKR